MRIKRFSFKLGKFISPFIIVIVGAFLRFDRIVELMMFIGDQGWFYLSARDMILTGNIPLIGITSSHTWLHQGPIWTYMLAGALFVSNFHPVSGAILTGAIGLGTVFLIYRIGSDFFSKNLGLIAALLYASSPLVIIHERMPYHTSPIPFFVSLLIYSLIKTIRGSPNWFPIVFLSISFLYNFELAAVVFIPAVLLIIILGFYKQEQWIKPIKNRKIIILSISALLIPMIPILIYDVKHGFPQTIKFAGWFFYKALQMMGLIEKVAGEPASLVVQFFTGKISLLIFAPNVFISVMILAASITFSGIIIFKKKNLFSPLTIIFFPTVIAILGFFAAGTRSEAYLPMLFPGIILLITFAFYSFFENKYHAVLVIITIAIINVLFVVQNNYFIDRTPGYGSSLSKRIEAVETIINKAGDQEYNIKGRGEGSEFESFTMNYEYLLWWKGKPSSKEKQDLVFLIEEKQGEIDVKIK